MEQTNNNIELLWIPEHCSIDGNAVTASLAKEAIIEPLNNIPRFEMQRIQKGKMLGE